MGRNDFLARSITASDDLTPGTSGELINVGGIEISWDADCGTCNFRGVPVALMWVDATLAGLMSGMQSMIGPERFNLALQAAGRKSIEPDWLLISSHKDFVEGFNHLKLTAKVAGWGAWQLVSYDPKKRTCRFRAYNNWEGLYQKSLGVSWGSSMLAGKLAGICGKLFDTNCWATQTRFVTKDHAFDEFAVEPSDRNPEQEIETLLGADQATRNDMAVALRKLQDAEKVLRDSEQRYDQLIRKIPDGTYIFQVETNGSNSFKYVSPRFCQMLGMNAHAALKAPGNVFALIHPDDLSGFERTTKESFATLKPFRWEGRFVIAGADRWMRVSSDATPMTNGASLWYGIVSDITERMAVETELRIAATAFESSEGIMITDANQVILRVNQSFIKATGYSAEELVGRTPRLIQSGLHDEGFYDEIWRQIRETGSWQGEVWDRRKNGEMFPKRISIKAVKHSDGSIMNYVSCHTDISDKKKSEEEIKHLAFYDHLTNLPNRRLLLDRLQQAIITCNRKALYGALFLIDLDHFKTLNDTLGHDQGDLLLENVALRLCVCVRQGDTVARLGGDEFVVLLEELSGSAEDAATLAKTVAEKIIATLRKPYRLNERDHYSTPSIGITLFGDRLGDIADLMKQADIAMYQAKADGRNTMHFFDPTLQAAVQARTAMAEDLRQGIATGQLNLYYQPQIEIDRVVGVEALLRWRHPGRGMVSPGEFIPLAEETGLILPLGLWVLETACALIRTWAARRETAELTVAVNVSAHQLRQPDFVEQVLAVLDRTKANPARLKLELTESMLVNNVEEIIAKMTALKSHGIRFSLDDFGTGYSSLSYLKRLPLSQLKIDKSFVMDVLTDPNDAAIARTIIALGHTLGLPVIAEGVETAAQCEFLARSGCSLYQGYLFGRPVPAEEFEEMLMG